MGTDGFLVAYADFSDPQREQAFSDMAAETEQVLKAVDGSLSANISTSFVSRFNAAAAGERVELDERAFTVLNIAIDAYNFTGGSYNPAVYYGVQAFGFGSDWVYPQTSADLPSTAQTDLYAELASHFSEVITEQKEGKYYATKPQFTINSGDEELSLKIDLGGVGKGYAVDLIDGLFEKYGFEMGYFSFGSSSIALKKFTDGDFKLQFVHPRKSGGAYLSIPLSCSLLSTSGDYEKYYVLDGARYCHIIDPSTCRPITSGMAAVTVIGGTAAEDDAITTALMTMTPAEAVSFINSKLSTRRVAFACEEGGELRYYTNMQGGFELLDGALKPLT